MAKSAPRIEYLLGWLRSIIAVWLICYYLLPNTVWEQLSIGGLLIDQNAWIRLRSGETISILATFLIAILTVGLMAYYSKDSTKWPNRFLPSIGIASYFIPGLVSLLCYRNNPLLSKSIESVITSVSCGILAALICKDLRRFIAVICFTALIQALYTIYYVHAGVNGFHSGNILRAGGTFDHPNGVYTLMLVAIPLAVSNAYSNSTRTSTFYWACASFMFTALLLTWFRGGMFGLPLH